MRVTSWSACCGCTGPGSTADRKRGPTSLHSSSGCAGDLLRSGGRMPELAFDCVAAGSNPYAAGPTLTFRLRIAETTGVQVHAIALRCQFRIEPQKRRYSDDE